MRENNVAAASYEAFISYRHQTLDTAVAKAIHKQLETYRIPAYIRKRTGKAKMGKVFRDQDELPLLADLGEGIRRALEASEWLIVICSPDLLLSKWCMAEIDYFIELGKRDRILTVLIAGEPEKSFPPQLRFVSDVSGEKIEREPLAADVRADSLSKSIAKVKKEKLRLLAPMLEVGFDDLRRRQRERFLRLVIATSLSAALFFAVFGGFALYQSATISRQNAALEEQKSRIYAGFSQEQLARGNRAGAALLALEALSEDTALISREAKSALFDAAYRSYGDLQPVMQVPGSNDSVLAPDGKTFVAADADCARVYDAHTFRLIYEHPGVTTTIMAFESGDISGAKVKRAVYNKAGDTVFLPGGTPVFVNVRTGKAVKEGYFTDTGELADFGLSRYECVDPYDPQRYIIDLASGETLFSAPTDAGTSQNLFSPNDKYYIVATYHGLGLYDIATGSVLNIVPCDGMFVSRGYTFFSPDSRFLVLTRNYVETVTVAGVDEAKRIYVIQVLEIPSCRVVYENTLQADLPNYYHSDDSDMPALLFSPEGSKLLLPVSKSELGVFDLAREEMLYTLRELPRFASFSPSGRTILTISQAGTTMELLDAQTGERTARFYNSDVAFLRGYILPDENAVFLSAYSGGSNLCGLYELHNSAGGQNIDLYFNDQSGRYIQFAHDGENAAIVDDKNGTVIELEDSTDYERDDIYSSKGQFAAAGDVVVGLSDAGTESKLTSWDAVTGRKLVSTFHVSGYFWTSFPVTTPFFLSQDGKRIAVIYHRPEVNAGGFQIFDAKTGELLSENDSLVLSDVTVLFDRDITKVLYIYNNVVRVFDALTGKELFALDDYPKGQLGIGIWSGHKAAVSDDGSLIAISHSKKGTLEIIDTKTGERLHETPLGGAATTNPCFSHDGKQVVIGAGKYLIAADTATGETLFSLYDEDVFQKDYQFSADDNYLLGPDIRDAKTGETACSVSLPPQPSWTITETAGVTIPVGSAQAIYLPTIEEVIEALQAHIQSYKFTRQDNLKFALN